MKFVVFYLIIFCASISHSEVLSIEELDKRIEKNNKEVIASKLRLEAAEKRLGHFFRSMLPKFYLYGGYESFETGIYSIREQPLWGAEATINIFRGGKDYITSSINDEEKIIRVIEVGGTLKSIIRSAHILYWNHAALLELIESYKEIKILNEKNYNVAKTRINRGVATDTDRIEFEIFKGQLDEEIESLSHESLLVRIELGALVNKDSNFTTINVVSHSHDENLLNRKKENLISTRYSLLEAKQRQADLKSSFLNRWWLPDADIYAGQYLYNLRDRDYLNERNRIDTVVGIKLTLNLDFFGEGYTSIAEAMDSEALSMSLQQEKTEFKAKLEVAQEDLKHEHELVHLSEERINLAKTYLTKTLDEYRRGVKNSVDVLTATQRLLEIRKEYVNRRRNYQVLKATLLDLLNENDGGMR